MVSNSKPGQFPPGLDDVKILSESHMISLIYIPVVVRRWRQRKDRPMATMKDLWAQMTEKLTTQAAEIAVLKE